MDRADERIRPWRQGLVLVVLLRAARDRVLLLDDGGAVALADLDVVGDRARVVVLEVDNERRVTRDLEGLHIERDVLRLDLERGRPGWGRRRGRVRDLDQL